MAYRPPLQEISRNNTRFRPHLGIRTDLLSSNTQSNNNDDSNNWKMRDVKKSNHKRSNDRSSHHRRGRNENARFVFHPNDKALGSGAYGTVYAAYDRILGVNVAIKVIKPQETNALLCPTTIREIGLLKMIKHENIISLLDMNQEARKSIIYLVFERAHFDLKKFWNKYYQKDNFNFVGNNKKTNIITISLIKTILIQIISAVSFLHSIKIIHRDIKPQNILLFLSSAGNGNGYVFKVKIADFGLARGNNQPNLSLTTEVVTLWYRPIELLLGCNDYDKSVDVWAIGCVLYELITNQPLFPSSSQIETIMKIFQLLGTPSRNNWNAVESLRYFQPTFPRFSKTPWTKKHIIFNFMQRNVIDLLDNLVRLDPKRRISLSNARRHSFLASYHL